MSTLFRNVSLLILDEPTAVLTPVEIAGLFAALRRIVSERRSVIFITHKLEEVMEIADQISVLAVGDASRTSPLPTWRAVGSLLG